MFLVIVPWLSDVCKSRDIFRVPPGLGRDPHRGRSHRGSSRRARLLVMAALLASVALAACSGPHRGVDRASPETSTSASRLATTGLARAIYPHCDFPGFRRVSVASVHGIGGQGWNLSYLPLAGSQFQPGVTSTVLIIEQSPRLPWAGMKGGHTIVVAGRRVSLRAPTSRIKAFGAQWHTVHARYLALANGTDPAVLEHFIACLR